MKRQQPAQLAHRTARHMIQRPPRAPRLTCSSTAVMVDEDLAGRARRRVRARPTPLACGRGDRAGELCSRPS